MLIEIEKSKRHFNGSLFGSGTKMRTLGLKKMRTRGLKKMRTSLKKCGPGLKKMRTVKIDQRMV